MLFTPKIPAARKDSYSLQPGKIPTAYSQEGAQWLNDRVLD